MELELPFPATVGLVPPLTAVIRLFTDVIDAAGCTACHFRPRPCQPAGLSVDTSPVRSRNRPR